MILRSSDRSTRSSLRRRPSAAVGTEGHGLTGPVGVGATRRSPCTILEAPARRPAGFGGRGLRAACIALAVLAACAEDPTGPDLREVEYAEFLEVDLDTFTEHPSGIFYKDIRLGEGPAAQDGSYVDIAVEGWLNDGQLVQPFFTLTNIRIGDDRVIEGLEIALVGMRPQSERKVVVPPHLAHGRAQVMVFRLNVMDVR